MDIEKEQLKLQIIELKQAVLHYQHREVVASINALTAATNTPGALAPASTPGAIA